VAAQLGDVYLLVLPETVLVLSACIIFVGGTFRTGRHLWAAKSFAVLVGAGLVLFFQVVQLRPSPPDMVRPLVFDHLALLIKIVALLGGTVLVFFSVEEVPDDRAADYYACLLIIVAGLSLTAAANDLVFLFLSLELISIPTYVILYLQRTDKAAQESAAKYFLLSIFSTAILLFGFSYLYGLAGTTNLAAVLNALGAGAADGHRLPLLSLVALVMIAAGLGFKITAVPFHFYAPDVYQGTTLSSAALLAFVPKVAGFIALIRVLGFIWPQEGRLPGLALGSQAPILFWILAAMTMSVGNILALLQDNLKRLLAYSSVAHAGYMLIGLAVAPDLAAGRGAIGFGGVDAVLFYLLAYVAMTIGAFAVIAYLSTPQQPIETVDDLAGVSRSHPGVALLMALFLFSLIGMPATAGFAGKFFLFFGALSVPPDSAGEEHAQLFRWLALIGAVNAAIGAWYYLRIVAAMYLRTPIRPLDKPHALPGLAAMWICAAVTLVLGVYPELVMNAVRAAAGGP
jgi:NADH-quinone oxidoreductase subunit N